MNIFPKKYFIPLLFLTLVLLSSYLIRKTQQEEIMPSFSQNFKLDDANYIEIAGVPLKVELAISPEAQQKGLSGREKMSEEEGMLFIFDKPDKYSFWMKQMKFSIDIIWLDENFKVIFLEKNISPDTYPKTFYPDKQAKYILEVLAGFAEKNNLKVGDSMRFLP